MAFIRARVIATKTVLYEDQDGREFIREGGSRAWRNFNPGNIEKGDFAKEFGSIGGDTRFAIFPDEATGLAAVVGLLEAPSYRNLTLEEAINRYAPPSENNTAGYVAFVENKTGIARNRILSTLPKSDLKKISLAIKQIEGWIPGAEYENKPFSILSGELGAPASSAVIASTDWLDVARREASLPVAERSQWADPGENPRILNYFEVACPWFDAKSLGGDEVDWCAAFVNFCLESSGYVGTGHPGARSFYWNKNNRFIKFDEPVTGAVVVFRDRPFDDEDWDTGTGHVGFLVGSAPSTVDVLGGNQGGTIKVTTFQKATANRRVVGYYVPAMN